MLTSRGILLGKAIQNFVKASPNGIISVRNAGHGAYYRIAPPPASKKTRVTASVCAGFAYWWIFWHIYHESEHITGEFPYPDVSKWTNYELGIPPDQ